MDRQTSKNRLKSYIILSAFIVVSIISYIVGNRDGKNTIRQHQVKQQLKTNEKQIDSVQGAKTIDAVNTSTESKKSVIRATMIIRGQHITPPLIKDTTNEYKKQYIKNFKI